MTKRFAFSLFATLFLIFGITTCSAFTLFVKKQVIVTSQTKVLKPGLHTYTIQQDGRARKYILYVPRSYNARRATPLLVAFHGGLGNMNLMGNDRYYGLISSAEKQGTLLAIPNGTSSFPWDKLATWNTGPCCGYAQENNIDDVGFTKSMINHIQQKVYVDKTKIYATGISNGGMMSYKVACEMSDVFSAVAPVAALDEIPDCHPGKPVSIIHFHALDDSHVVFSGGVGEDAMVDRSRISVPDTIQKWVTRNACATTPHRILEKNGAYCDLYSGCQSGSKVQLCVTPTGAHSWPGAPGKPTRNSDTPSQAISANDEMWKFFNTVSSSPSVSSSKNLQ